MTALMEKPVNNAQTDPENADFFITDGPDRKELQESISYSGEVTFVVHEKPNRFIGKILQVGIKDNNNTWLLKLKNLYGQVFFAQYSSTDKEGFIIDENS